MAFNPQETQIIQHGLQSGKSQEDVMSALANFRANRTARVLEDTPESVGFVQDLAQDIKQVGTEIKSSVVGGMDTFSDIDQAQESGEQGMLRSLFQKFGTGAGVAGDAISSTIKGGIKALLPQKAEDVIKTGIETVAEPIVKSKPVQSIVQFYEGLDEDSKRDVDAVLGIGKLAVSLKGAEGIAKTAQQAGQLAKSATQKAISTADDVVNSIKTNFSGAKTKIGDSIIPVPKTVQTTLRRTDAGTLKKYLDQAKQATVDNKNATPLELAGESATDALNRVQSKLNTIGSQKSTLVSKAAVSNKPMGNIALKTRQDINRMFNVSQLDKADKSLVTDLSARLKSLGSNPTLKQVDDFVDYAQEQIYKGSSNLALPIGSKTESGLRKIIGQVNSQVKKAAPKNYSQLNSRYSELIEIRNQLNKALGTESNKGGSLLKRVFSPTDGGTKKLFEKVLKETGIDLNDEATLAKFAMELYGDVRQRSLLQQLNIPTQRGLIDTTLKFGGDLVGLDDLYRNLQISKAKSLIGR